jgi:hypothetical protein
VQKAELDDAVTQLGQLKLELQKSQSEVQAEKAHATALVTEKGKANQRVHELRKQIVDGSEQMRKEVEEVKKQVGRSSPDVCLQTSCAGACAMLAGPHFVFICADERLAGARETAAARCGPTCGGAAP